MEKIRAGLLKTPNSKSAMAMENKIHHLESKMFDINQTGARWDIFRSGAQILERFLAQAKEGIIYSADNPPTDQQIEVYNVLNQQLSEVQAAFELLKQDKEIKKLEK